MRTPAVQEEGGYPILLAQPGLAHFGCSSRFCSRGATIAPESGHLGQQLAVAATRRQRLTGRQPMWRRPVRLPTRGGPPGAGQWICLYSNSRRQGYFRSKCLATPAVAAPCAQGKHPTTDPTGTANTATCVVLYSYKSGSEGGRTALRGVTCGRHRLSDGPSDAD